MSPGDATFTRFQRMLLATDGTVTHVVEAYAGEPVEVVKLRQETDVCDEADVELDLSPDEKVLRRRVLLRGRHSKRPRAADDPDHGEVPSHLLSGGTRLRRSLFRLRAM